MLHSKEQLPFQTGISLVQLEYEAEHCEFRIRYEENLGRNYGLEGETYTWVLPLPVSIYLLLTTRFRSDAAVCTYRNNSVSLEALLEHLELVSSRIHDFLLFGGTLRWRLGARR